MPALSRHPISFFMRDEKMGPRVKPGVTTYECGGGSEFLTHIQLVMAGLDPAIHAFTDANQKRKTWMRGSSPGMT
jgi:hypothetical protein